MLNCSSYKTNVKAKQRKVLKSDLFKIKFNVILNVVPMVTDILEVYWARQSLKSPIVDALASAKGLTWLDRK